MPLSDLIHYFNSTDAAGDSTLYLEAGRAAAWHDGLRLRSLFQPIVDLATEQVVGHHAFLAAEDVDGQPLASEAAYARCATAEAIVHFDRLCRTLHALNFLAQRRHAGGYLQLAVHHRHLLAVPSQHGLVFEAVLKRCGLAPLDIVLELQGGSLLDNSQLSAAVHNYRERGYRIAWAGPAGATLAFTPDIVKCPLGSALGAGTTPAHVDRLRHADDLAQARRQGFQLGQGSLFGQPRPECVSTHKPGPLTYNRAD